jgi:class 3 adenylate cyclase
MLDLRRAEAVLNELADAPDAEPLGMATTRTVRVFMFTDIVDSTRLAETLGDQAWDGLIRWHDRTLRAAVAEQGGEEVKATGDGFFLAFTDPDPAIEAAVTIPGLQSRRGRRGRRDPGERDHTGRRSPCVRRGFPPDGGAEGAGRTGRGGVDRLALSTAWSTCRRAPSVIH